MVDLSLVMVVGFVGGALMGAAVGIVSRRAWLGALVAGVYASALVLILGAG